MTTKRKPAAKPHRRWIVANPFGELKHWCEVNTMRNVYIERRDVICILEELTDNHVRLAVALARFGGLRSPSEALDLKWSDIDWADNTMSVHCLRRNASSVKSGESYPFFSELLPYLESMYQRIDEGGSPMVFDTFQGAPWSAFSRRLEAACRRLGLAMWMKPFTNMRAPRTISDYFGLLWTVYRTWVGCGIPHIFFGCECVPSSSLEMTNRHFDFWYGLRYFRQVTVDSVMED